MLELHNFVLGISNLKQWHMKKTIIMILISLGIIVSLALWIGNSEVKLYPSLNIEYIIIAILVLFSLILAVSRIGSLKKGLPAEDELSKKLLKNAAARSYYFSLYLWLALSYLSSEGKIEQDKFFAIGIVGMAVLFAVHWIILKFTGIRNE